MASVKRRLVLASASASRLRLLRNAGFDPVVVVSGVDESELVESDPRRLVETLAVRKADAVVQRGLPTSDAVVVGCDSMLWFDGRILGKPSDSDVALRRWREMRGREGTLFTGHCVIDLATNRRASAVAETIVAFGSPTDEELAAYIATGEPLAVAGGFTLDGLGAPFIDGIRGDYGNVIGISLPLLRTLLGSVGVDITEFWC